MKLNFTYPFVDYDEDDPENSPVTQEEGGIDPIRLDREPYEAELNTMDSCFHLIFGHYTYGCFLCIPSLNLGCEFEDFKDTDWNMHVLLDTDIPDYEESEAIAIGLSYISDFINQQWPAGAKAPVYPEAQKTSSRSTAGHLN